MLFCGWVQAKFEARPDSRSMFTPEEHQKLKAIAALQGQSIKDHVLNRTLGEVPALDGLSEHEAFCALADFLKPRIEQARRGELSSKSVAEIRREAREWVGPQRTA